jgi:hypothetical protein
VTHKEACDSFSNLPKNIRHIAVAANLHDEINWWKRLLKRTQNEHKNRCREVNQRIQKLEHELSKMEVAA